MVRAPTIAAVVIAALLAVAPAPVQPAGAAYVVRSPSAGLYGRPNAAEPQHTLIKGQVVTVLQRRGEWYRIITEHGREGWVRESAVTPVPDSEVEESMIDEASPDEVTEAVFYDFVIGRKRGNVRRQPRVGAPIVRTAPEGEVFTIVGERGSWYQVARDGAVEGWMHESVGVKRESKNLSLRIMELLDGRLTVFDQIKSEASQFRRAGWFPSFFLRNAEEDIHVEESPGAGTSVTVHLSYARKDIEYRTVIEGAEAFALPAANRTFLSDLLLSLLELSPAVRRAGIRLWFAVLETGGTISWRNMGEMSLEAGAARAIPRGEKADEAVWAALESNTVPGGLWQGLQGE